MPNLRKVVIVDYKLSNLFSVNNALKKININAQISSYKKDIASADLIILPGTGTFSAAMKNLRENDLLDNLASHIKNGKPFLGICLGFQLLFSSSSEIKKTIGLNIFKSKIKKIKNETHVVPNIGWNKIKISQKKNPKLKSEYFYFVHSYYADILEKEQKIVSSYIEYQKNKVCSSITYNNIFATQFHPEKSGKKGLELMKNIIKFYK
jgi:glutamine amidotransferase